MALPDVIKTALEHIQHIAKAETIFGEPITVGGVTLIPVSRVSIGFAAGGAGKDEKSASGAGAGGGVNVTPVALVSISGPEIKIHSLESGEIDLGTLLAKTPDAVRKLAKYLKKKFGDDKDEKNGGDSGGSNGKEPPKETPEG
ncbi:MAG: sporulation protein [Chitinispirillia bacterium]|nr:sporulation protein [Chitinispirillia bacterium]MCL2268082.1 sporulation protein [Chitinispirillia bacterium]